MISLIICGRTSEIPYGLKENIQSTIGVPFELVWIDNSSNQLNIYEAYNIGVSRSQYPFLCFMHDDIKYHSIDWGARVIAHFNDECTGAIGIAGSAYLSYMPSPWWSSDMTYEHLLRVNEGKLEPTLRSVVKKESKNEVVLLDGVWICIRRNLFKDIKFEQVLLTGFHFYDLDISMQIHCAGYKLYCISDILVEHNSYGRLNNLWLENTLNFRRKWKSKLPAKVVKLRSREIWKIEIYSLLVYISIKKRFSLNSAEVYKEAYDLLLHYPSPEFYLWKSFYLLKFQLKRFLKLG